MRLCNFVALTLTGCDAFGVRDRADAFCERGERRVFQDIGRESFVFEESLAANGFESFVNVFEDIEL
jgi:hypothetical protein